MDWPAHPRFLIDAFVVRLCALIFIGGICLAKINQISCFNIEIV